MYSGHDLPSQHAISALWKFYGGRRSVAGGRLTCYQRIADAEHEICLG